MQHNPFDWSWSDADLGNARAVDYLCCPLGSTHSGERTAKPEPDGVEHRRRWVVERTFAWISKHRRCVRDYETKPDHHEAMIYIAMIMNMSRRLARTGDW